MQSWFKLILVFSIAVEVLSTSKLSAADCFEPPLDLNDDLEEIKAALNDQNSYFRISRRPDIYTLILGVDL